MDTTQLHADIAGLRADVQATNKNVERIAALWEKTLDDHEVRIRKTEIDQPKFATKDEIQSLRDFQMKVLGVLAVLNLIGIPGVYVLLTHLGGK